MYWVLAWVVVMTSVCTGQVDGPWTVWEGEGLADSLAFRVLARDDSTTCLFYQIGGETWYQEFDATGGHVRGWPSVLSVVGPGYSRTLCDVVVVGDTCNILVYDLSLDYNRTRLVRKTVDSAVEYPLDEGRNNSVPYFGSSVNFRLRMYPHGPSTCLLSWIDYWTWYGWFWEAGSGIVISEINFATGERTEQAGGYDGHDDGWIVDTQADTPIVIGIDDNSSLCLGDYDGLMWSPCNWSNGWDFSCSSAPLLCWTDSTRRLWILSRSGENYWGHFPAGVVRIDTANWTCERQSEFDRDPLAATVNEGVGVAWLSLFAGGLDLSRTTLEGEVIQIAGAIDWTQSGYRVLAAALCIGADGKVYALWSEERLSNPLQRRLRLAAVAWDTPLAIRPIHESPIPGSLSLAAFPNPFNSELRVRYEVGRPQSLSLKVYDLSGREVATFGEATVSAGSHEVSWNAAGVSSGVYFLRLTGETGSAMAKVLLIK